MAERARTGVDELLDEPPSRTTPWLLELARRQAARRRPADLLRQWTRDSFVAPGAVDLREVHALDGIALEAAAGFEAVLLSPVAPLGVCSALAPTSQDRTLSAHRGTEVVSDPTNALALECAARLSRRPTERVRLCTAHQTLRAQSFPDEPGYSRHFRLFAMAQAGRGLADDGFERRAVVEHVSAFDRMFDAAIGLGCAFEERRAEVLASPDQQTLGDRVRGDLEAALPDIAVASGELANPYYDGLRVLFGATSTRTGRFVAVADTGRFDWVARLCADRKVRYVASGIGVQLFRAAFAADTGAGDDQKRS